MPMPALVSTSTSWPAWTSSATEAGVRPTRYSWFLISLGTPTRMASLQNPLCANSNAGYRRESLQVLLPRVDVTHENAVLTRLTGESCVMDRIDGAILKLLAADARASVSAIAAQVGLSQSACTR